MLKYKLFDGTQTITLMRSKKKKEIIISQDLVERDIVKLKELNEMLSNLQELVN